ncbi:hypothetical protein RN001_003585 [Aquatica leii]|uniref:Uncharacterized protein n=1 Tax=Aquatica leii TaxID=1421715 RepID=A0AAN7Q6G8_9COLE|nr:hypothetical protein RN001_003585 [Aquatica leii]
MTKCCQKKCARCAFLTIGCVFITIGVVFALFWGTLYNGILNSELVLTNTSKSYEFWKETPIPMYLKVHLFNWTNAKEVIDSHWKIKPVLDQRGPYVFYEHHIRENITWNQNETISFRQRKIWHFEPSLSNGTLNDTITNVNPVCVVIVNKVKNMPYLVKRAVNAALVVFKESLYVSKTVDELLFTGYHDKILDELHEFNVSLPFDKFAWFYGKNNSVTFDGTFTMHTGKTNLNLLGELTLWNGASNTSAYTNSCSEVKGTTGELWHPVKDFENVQIFASDICGPLPFQHNGSESTCNISGKKFKGTDFAFDNGTKYSEQACFKGKQVIPSGLRDVSKCKFGAPAFISYPHFYLADPVYNESVIGMKPNKSEHESYLVIEGLTGIPLNVNVQLQLNILLEPITDISMFEDIKPTYMPALWFSQVATLTDEYCKLTHLLVAASDLGTYLGWTVFSLGLVFSIIGFIMLYHKKDFDELEEQLIPNQ